MLSLSVVSPVKKILQTTCTSVTVPTESGIITILPNHASLFSLLNSGEVIVHTEAKEVSNVVVSGGFVSVMKNEVTLLVDFGINSQEMDEKLIMEAKERAEKMLTEAKSENISEKARADLLHASLQLQFLHRHGKNRGANNPSKTN